MEYFSCAFTKKNLKIYKSLLCSKQKKKKRGKNSLATHLDKIEEGLK